MKYFLLTQFLLNAHRAGHQTQKKENREPEIRDEGLAEHNFFLKNDLDESDK